MDPYRAVPGAGTWHQMEPEGPNPSGVLVLGLNPGLQHILRLRVLDLGQDGWAVVCFQFSMPFCHLRQWAISHVLSGWFWMFAMVCQLGVQG